MKLLFPTPVIYDGNDPRFLARDGARFAQYLSSHGHEGIKVILSDATSPSNPKSPLLAMETFRQWCDPEYWRSFQADGALCYFGLSSKRFVPVVAAMKAAGLRLALKMDSAMGIQPQTLPSLDDFRRLYWRSRNTRTVISSTIQALLSTARMVVFSGGASLLSFLEAFELITVESPLAADNTKAWCRRKNRTDLAEKVIILPHPVPDDFRYDPHLQSKQKRIFATALDWDNPRKGGRITAKALSRFLMRHPNWTASIVGNNSSQLAAMVDNDIEHFPQMISEKLLPYYQSSMIFITASGEESGPIVAFEALACGCSIVFPPHLRQLSWSEAYGMGTMSSSRTPESLVEALEKEASRWERTPIRFRSDRLPPLRVSELSERLLEELMNRSCNK